MKSIVRAVVAVLCLGLLAALPAAAQAQKPTKPKLYLALGDSLAVGVQPRADGQNRNTGQGYANQLARRVGRRQVRLVNYGCGGATTESFIRGNKACGPSRRPGYRNTSPRTSQLAAAERLLRRNHKRTAFVTIDIGANDVASCAAGGGIDIECVNEGIAAIKRNAPKIARRLRAAAGRGVTMSVMTLYNPFLQQWFNGDSGKALAEASVDIARDQVNAELIRAFRPRGFKIARVAEDFNTYIPFERTATYRGQRVPVAVRDICRLTWMCAAAPRGPNIHANKAGYARIATSFRRALGRAAR